MSRVFLGEHRISLPQVYLIASSAAGPTTGSQPPFRKERKMQSKLKTTLFIAAAALFVIAGTQAQAGGDTAALDAALLSSMQGPSDPTADAGDTLTETVAAAGEVLGLDGDAD
jgi:hypothetical protein